MRKLKTLTFSQHERVVFNLESILPVISLKTRITSVYVQETGNEKLNEAATDSLRRLGNSVMYRKYDSQCYRCLPCRLNSSHRRRPTFYTKLRITKRIRNLLEWKENDDICNNRQLKNQRARNMWYPIQQHTSKGCQAVLTTHTHCYFFYLRITSKTCARNLFLSQSFS